MDAPLAGFDPDCVRMSLERQILSRLTRDLGAWSPTPRDYEEVRREWFWASELLPEPQRARSSRLAMTARARLGVERELELFQKAGKAHHLNAATNCATDGPILVQLRGPLLDRLDDAGVIAVLGHEIGHHLAHGPRSVGGLDPFFVYRLHEKGRRAGYREIAAAYCRAAELTADRIGLLACRDVDAVVRMEAVVEGCASEVATQRLVQEARAYAEDLGRRGRRSLGDSHPETAVRIYAMWLFSETDVYRELTGLGPATRSLADVDRTLARLVGPAESAEDMGLPPEGEPCLLDRARDLLVALSRGDAGHDREEEPDLGELDVDPLEEKFAELERRQVVK